MKFGIVVFPGSNCDRDMVVAILGLNVGVMAVATAFSTAEVSAGVGLVLFGILLSVIVSLVIARRMVRPIQALTEGAGRIGAGDLAGVRQEWESYERVLVADPWSDGEPAPKLLALRRELLSPAAS